jgi:hypothetical protein
MNGWLIYTQLNLGFIYLFGKAITVVDVEAHF